MERVMRILVTIPDNTVQEMQESDLTEADILAEAAKEMMKRPYWDNFQAIGTYEFIEFEESETP